MQSGLLQNMRSRVFFPYLVGSSTSCSMKLDSMNSNSWRADRRSERSRLLPVSMEQVSQLMNGKLKSPPMKISGT